MCGKSRYADRATYRGTTTRPSDRGFERGRAVPNRALRYCGSVSRPTAVRHFTLSAYVAYALYLGYGRYRVYVTYAAYLGVREPHPRFGGCTVSVEGAG